MLRHESCWAKTTGDGQPGISVRDHCLNVGCVAGALLSRVSPAVRSLLPAQGIETLSALHDMGKVSPGFQVKCPAWMRCHGLGDRIQAWIASSESDHAKVSQYALQQHLSPGGPNLWAAVVGAHHGAIKGDRIGGLVEADAGVWSAERRRLRDELEKLFGKLPEGTPSDCICWLAAGLIAVADWVGSDERHFPQAASWSVEQRRQQAEETVDGIGFAAGAFRAHLSFADLFPLLPGHQNALQQAVVGRVRTPGLYVIEGPMGCGKTEAALAAAYELVSSGVATGIYFALPTQTTSNRIHLRVADFLRHAGSEAAILRLAHASSWLDADQVLSVVPAWREATGDERESAVAGRTWFASSKRALLAPFGVGTVDQALLGVVAAKHFFVRQFGLAGKVVILDEIHSYDLYTGTLIDALVKRLLELQCTVIVLSATLTRERRRELLGVATSAAYPLLAARTDALGVVEIPVEYERAQRVHIAFRDSAVLLDAALARAAGGDCVLWIRNTVGEAQQTYLRLLAASKQGGPDVGLLHARLPFFQRAALEETWMERLGRDATKRPVGGCILVATQVVEQSVDIDADLLITDLAPTDMLFQRMGRLWRHQRKTRPCEKAEAWIAPPTLTLDALRQASAREIEIALGKSARVYAPYVLLRSLEQWQKVRQVALPGDIRPILEGTYDPLEGEPSAWRDLREELEKKREGLACKALSATQVWSNPALKDEEGIQTRYGQFGTVELLLVTRAEEGRCVVEITLSDENALSVPRYAFDFAAAKAIHRSLVRIPLWCVSGCFDATPEWLRTHVAGRCVLGILGAPCPDRVGRAVRVEGKSLDAQSGLYYREDLGIVIDRNAVGGRPVLRGPEDWDDESCD